MYVLNRVWSWRPADQYLEDSIGLVGLYAEELIMERVWPRNVRLEICVKLDLYVINTDFHGADMKKPKPVSRWAAQLIRHVILATCQPREVPIT